MLGPKALKSFRKGMSRLQAVQRGRKARGQLPARFGPSKKQYGLNKKVSKIVKGLAETKLIAVTPFNEYAPKVPVNQSAPYLRYCHFILGSTLPTGWDTQAQMLGGTVIPNGTGASERIGSYAYLKKTTLMMDIDCTIPPQGTFPPLEFRLIVVKPKRYALQSGVTLGPQAGLFLNDVGGEIGYNSTGYNSTDVLRRPINKRNFQVRRDQRFVLTAPSAIPNAMGYSGAYKSMKSFRLSLPLYKKTKFDTAGKPYDIDTHYSIMIFARPIGKDHVPDNWEVNLRGTTSYTDM